jgi:outer membrane protein assembly factor BamE (lipoprotein component of BamABCDE complex)
MSKKTFVIVVALCLPLMLGMAACAKKHVRHLASDVSLVSPGTTTKQEVLSYLGQPDTEYEIEGGEILWVYYEAKKELLRGTPYIGEKIGEETYEIVKVTFNGDNVRDIDYRTMSEEEFNESGLAE